MWTQEGFDNEVIRYKTLWCAVILQAIHDLHDSSKRVRRDALWFFMHDLEFFPSVCDRAGVDHLRFRKQFTERLPTMPLPSPELQRQELPIP